MTKILRTQLICVISGAAIILTIGLTDIPPPVFILGPIWIIVCNVLLARLRCDQCGKRLMMTPYFFYAVLWTGSLCFLWSQTIQVVK